MKSESTIRLVLDARRVRKARMQAVTAELKELFATRKLSHVEIERGDEPPQQSRGGKFRTVIPLGAGGEDPQRPDAH